MSFNASADIDKSTNVRSVGQRDLRSTHPSFEAIKLALRAVEAISPALAARWLERLFFTPRRYARPAREVELLETARPFSVLAAGRELACLRFGDSPRTVLLVHGWEGRGTQLGAVIPGLLARGLSVVTFDAPAHGDSPGARTNALEFAQSICSVAMRAGPFEGILAHSLGSVATTVALHGGLKVPRVVYIAPWCSAPQAVVAFGGHLGLSEQLLGRVKDNIAARLHFDWDSLALGKLAPSMTSSLLVAHDARDAEVPLVEGEALVNAWPGARLVVTEGLGHRRILRDPAVVAAAVEHLAAS